MRNRPFTVNSEHRGVCGGLVDRSSGVVDRRNGGQHCILYNRQTGARARARASRRWPINAARGRCMFGGGKWKNQLRSYAKSGGRWWEEEKEKKNGRHKKPERGTPARQCARTARRSRKSLIKRGYRVTRAISYTWVQYARVLLPAVRAA